PNRARADWALEEADDNDHLPEPRLEDAEDRDVDDKGRQGLEDVHDLLGELVEPAAVIAAGDADRRPDSLADHHSAEGNDHRHASAEEEAAEDVAAELVRAEDVLRAPPLEAVAQVVLVETEGRDAGPEAGHGAALDAIDDHLAAEMDAGGLEGRLG